MVRNRAVDCQTLNLKEAARELGMHPQYLAKLMRNKEIDIGCVFPPKKKGGKHDYRIYRAKLDKHMGIERRKNE